MGEACPLSSSICSSAAALTEPLCSGIPHANDPAIHHFSVTTANREAGAVSGIRDRWLACGTSIAGDFEGAGTIYDHVDVGTPPGVEIASTASMDDGRYVGNSVANLAYHDSSGSPHIDSMILSTFRTDDIDDCAAENPVGGDVPGAIVACYQGSNRVGTNQSWVTIDGAGRAWLTIGPFHGALDITAGLTHVMSLNLCDRAGRVGGRACGDSSQPFLQKNGSASVPNCENGNGVYTATATMRNGTTTPVATTCVEWWPAATIGPRVGKVSGRGLPVGA